MPRAKKVIDSDDEEVVRAAESLPVMSKRKRPSCFYTQDGLEFMPNNIVDNDDQNDANYVEVVNKEPVAKKRKSNAKHEQLVLKHELYITLLPKSQHVSRYTNACQNYNKFFKQITDPFKMEPNVFAEIYKQCIGLLIYMKNEFEYQHSEAYKLRGCAQNAKGAVNDMKQELSNLKSRIESQESLVGNAQKDSMAQSRAVDQSNIQTTLFRIQNLEYAAEQIDWESKYEEEKRKAINAVFSGKLLQAQLSKAYRDIDQLEVATEPMVSLRRQVSQLQAKVGTTEHHAKELLADRVKSEKKLAKLEAQKTVIVQAMEIENQRVNDQKNKLEEELKALKEQMDKQKKVSKAVLNEIVHQASLCHDAFSD